MRHTPITRKRTPSPVKPHRARSGWLWTAVAGLLVLLGGGLVFHGSPFGSQPPTPAATCPAGDLTATSVTGNAGERHLPAQRINTIQVGQRLVGRNPIREQAELVEPDPATWRKISLYMTKESGLGLWIDLLRPLSWIDERGAMVGGSIYFEMPDMGAVGDAQVTYIGPCPPIQPGDGGAVVIGRFKHEAEANAGVVHLELEDQIEPTGVTDNHPYWSVDRREFVPVGQLRVGELVDTIYGPKHVISVTPIDHDGFVYNVETTEHVYRVGELGTLVHNSCAHITLGLGSNIDAFTRSVRRRVGTNVERFPFRSLTKAADSMWQGIRRAMSDADSIHFNMKGMTKTQFQDWMWRGGHTYEPYPGASGVTNRELYEVLTDEALRKKVTFYDEFGEIDIPLDWLNF